MSSKDTDEGASVSPAPPGRPITAEHKNGFKIMKMAHSTMPSTLKDIYIMGSSSKLEDETLEDCFLRHTEMSMMKYKKIFDKFEREKMLSKDMSDLDVNQLFSLIKYGNQKLAGENDAIWKLENKDPTRLEWLLTAIKHERNTVFHNEPVLTKEQLLAKSDEIRSLLEGALQLAGNLYEKPSTTVGMIQKMKSEMIEIRDQDLSQGDIEDYKNLLLLKDLKNVLKAKGKCELKDTYKKWSHLSPASFLQGEDVQLDVKSVFVRLTVQKAGGKETGSLVSFENLIEFCRDSASGAESAPAAEDGTMSTSAARGRGKDIPAARGSGKDIPAARGRGKDISAARGRGKDISTARGRGMDIPAARGMGKDISAARGRGEDIPAVKSRGMDIPAARGRGKDTPAARGSGKDISAARGRGKDTSAARGRGMDIPAARGSGKDISAARGRGKDISAARGRGKDIPAARGSGKDISAARGRGKDIPAARGSGKDISAARGMGKDIPAARGRGMDIPAARGRGMDTSAARVRGKDISAARGRGEDIPAVKSRGKDIPAAKGRGKDIPAAKGRGKDIPAAKGRGKDIPAARGRGKDTPATRGRGEDIPAARGRGKDIPGARSKPKTTPTAGIRTHLLPKIILVEGRGGAGKTTLIKLLLSQWSDEAQQIVGLDQFDLVLLMECRNSRIDSFDDLLSHLLPKTNANHFKPGDLLKCARQLRLFVIIDGLDEMNQSSDLLFKDILGAQRTSDLVLLCTSRPEKVGYFYHMLPGEYRKVHLKILGIPEECKEQFLECYHDQLKAKDESVQNTADLLAYLRRSPECLKDHYQLPLNLVLLAWLWAGDPSRVTNITTPTELYTKYLQLIEKKLVERLHHNEKTKKMSEEELEQKIKVYLRALYNEALRALKKDCIEKLPNESFKSLKSVCNANSLPCEELLPAFLVLKSEGNQQHAIIPHKLEHDFYAARGLMFQLFDQATEDEVTQKVEGLSSFLSSWNVSTADKILQVAKAELQREIKGQRPGAIMSILSDVDGDDSDDQDLSKYQTLLVQLAGCLYIQSEHQVQDCTARDVVHLLKRSGMGRCDDNEWFQLLDNTWNDVTITNYVAEEIRGDLVVDESHINVARDLLQCGKPKRVILTIKGDPWAIHGLEPLLERVSEGQHPVDIYFHREFRQPKTHMCHRPSLYSVFSRCDVERVMCSLDGDSMLALPSSVRELYLVMAPGQQAVHLQANLPPQLEDLYLHVSVRDSPAEEWLSPVRDVPYVHLFLSDVRQDNIKQACRMAHSLQPEERGFQSIRLPGARLEEEGWMHLLHEMRHLGVQVRNCIMLPSHSLTKTDWRELHNIAEIPPFPYRVRLEAEEVIWLSFL
ncbi:uncharacterized protein [Panulirus ornatus]